MPLTYNPHIFDVATIDDAMRIILTPEGVPTEQRWAVETPYFAELIARSFPLTSDSILLDFGCGIGRLAKELILRHQCRVVGVDISPSMRALAEIYVDSDRFFSCPPAMLETLIDRGLRFDLALAIWVLQHSWQPQDDIDLIAEAIAPSGGLFVVNQKNPRRADRRSGLGQRWHRRERAARRTVQARRRRAAAAEQGRRDPRTAGVLGGLAPDPAAEA
ncbi:MAG: class I SAM-dependent methyltransferase, partial [Pseudomonadota bacterium]